VAKTHATQRTLKLLRDEGWIAHVVEKYMKHPGMPFGRRIDVWGFGDVLACRQSPSEIALIQCFPNTSGSGFAAHREKIFAIPESRTWLRSGGKIFMYGWKQRKSTRRWEWKREEVILA